MSKNFLIGMDVGSTTVKAVVIDAATDEILTDNGIRSQGSPDTLAIWNAKSSK